MRIKKFEKHSKYSKLYESKLSECDFLTENATVEDIIKPLEDLINEEFIDKLLKKGYDYVKNTGKSIGNAIGNVVSKMFNGVVNFFKNFSFKKLKEGISNYIKNTKVYKNIKKLLSGLTQFIIQNGLVDENNKVNFANIWKLICDKSKSLIDWGKEGVTPDKLASVGGQVKLNEGIHDIGDDEVKYYGFFEKVAHALGIKNARFNGVVSQIMKKGAIGVAIMSILKISGISFGFLGGLSLGPVAMAAIGGMLLMAGLIILAIWICKPYPTIDDCLSYLHIAFGNNIERCEMVQIFSEEVIIEYTEEYSEEEYSEYSSEESESESGSSGSVQSDGSRSLGSGESELGSGESELGSGESSSGSSEESKKGIYPLMIKNLKAIKGMIDNIDEIEIDGESSGKDGKKNKFEKGKEYIYLNKDGEKKKVKLISNDNQYKIGKDKKWSTKDDEEIEDLESGNSYVSFKNKNGEFSNTGTAVKTDRLSIKKESVLTFSMFEKVVLSKNEDYLVQAFKNIKKSINVLKDEKDKGVGITVDFVNAIIDGKMKSKDVIKSLYEEIYEHIEGKYSNTIPDLGPLYKESIEVISDKNKRKVVSEKIARLYKRTKQFEGENMYGGLGNFGKHMKEFNSSLNEIMNSLKK